MSTDTSLSGPAGHGRQRICFVVSSPMTAEAFLSAHIRTLSEHYDVHLIANADPQSIRHPDLQRATRLWAPIERAISPWKDAGALARLVGLLRRGRYSAVHSLTPKAGLLTAIAAYIARVPVRMHTYTGQVWATRRGPGRGLLKMLDRMIARLDTHLLVDSPSQLDFLRTHHVLGEAQGVVLGKGSVSGVDGARFKPDDAARLSVRTELAIPQEAIVVIFVGRLNREKGVLDLARAFADLAARADDLYLLFVGPDEQSTGAEIRAACRPYEARLRFVGWAAQPGRYMAACDIFCLPSYREGFGSVVIEAAAAGLPAIGSRIYGIIDAIDDGVTGLLVEPRSPPALAAAMYRLAGDATLRKALGSAARARALESFSQEAMNGGLLDFYRSVLPPVGGEGRASERPRL